MIPPELYVGSGSTDYLYVRFAEIRAFNSKSVDNIWTVPSYSSGWKALQSQKFDPVSLWERVGYDMQLLRELAEVFAAESPGMVGQIESALEQRDPVKLQKASHKLRGAVLQFSAHGAAEAAASLESMGKGSLLEEAPQVLLTLKGEITSLQEALATMIREDHLE